MSRACPHRDLGLANPDLQADLDRTPLGAEVMKRLRQAVTLCLECERSARCRLLGRIYDQLLEGRPRIR